MMGGAEEIRPNPLNPSLDRVVYLYSQATCSVALRLRVKSGLSRGTLFHA